METPLSARQRRPLHSYHGSYKSEVEEVVRVPLERVELGSWKYTATELEDIELLYELESSDLLIKTSVHGAMNGAVPATFRVRNVSAADFSLVNIVPGSLESMVVRLVLETESDVSYNHGPLNHDPLSVRDDYGGSHKAKQTKIKCHRITMTASVHETGHLRDILLFLKCGCVDDLSPDNLFISLKRRRSAASKVDYLKGSSITSSTISTTTTKHQITLLEGLPFWAFYIPWRLYSKKARIIIQRLFQLYLLFSVMWASWQLYRHVNVIHLALEPLVNILKLYLSSIMNTFDSLLALFTVWWTTFLNPLNVFCGALLAPVFRLALQLKGGLASLWRVLRYSRFLRALKLMALYDLLKIICRKLFMPAFQLVLHLRSGLASLWRFLSYSKLLALYDLLKTFCGKYFMPVLQFIGSSCAPIRELLSNSRLFRVFKYAFLGLYQLFQVMGITLWRVLRILGRPFYSVGKWVMNSRITEASQLEFKRIRQSWVVGLMINSMNKIGSGLAKFYVIIMKQKQIEAACNAPLTPSPPPRLQYQHRRMPVYYGSPNRQN